MIKRAYERLFAAFYGWSLKVDGKQSGDNVYSAVISLSLALFLNLITLAIIVDMLSPIPYLERATQVSSLWWILGAVAFTAVQYFYFRNGNHYRKVIAAFGPTEKHLAQGPHWKLIAYMVLSFVSFAGTLALGMK